MSNPPEKEVEKEATVMKPEKKGIIKGKPEKKKKLKGSEKKLAIKKRVELSKKVKKEKTDRKKMKRLMSMPEPRTQVLRALMGGLVAVLTIVALNYILWGINTSNNILYMGGMIDFLSMGNAINSLLGVWALSFTPLTSYMTIMSNWAEQLLFILLPIIVAGIFLGITTKRFSTAILGWLFFIFWGVLLPIIFVYIFPVFGLFDPTVMEGILIGILDGPIKTWNYDWLKTLFEDNLFISWSIAGALEYSLLVILIALPLAWIIQIIKR